MNSNLSDNTAAYRMDGLPQAVLAQPSSDVFEPTFGRKKKGRKWKKEELTEKDRKEYKKRQRGNNAKRAKGNGKTGK